MRSSSANNLGRSHLTKKEIAAMVDEVLVPLVSR